MNIDIWAGAETACLFYWLLFGEVDWDKPVWRRQLFTDTASGIMGSAFELLCVKDGADRRGSLAGSG